MESNNTIIVGGASGIGHAVARHFALHGATRRSSTSTPGRSKAPRAKSPQSGGKVLGLVADIRSGADVADAFRRSASQHGPINALVVTAGVLKPALLAEMPEAEYDLTFDVNTKGFWRCVKAALPHLSANAVHRGDIVGIRAASESRKRRICGVESSAPVSGADIRAGACSAEGARQLRVAQHDRDPTDRRICDAAGRERIRAVGPATDRPAVHAGRHRQGRRIPVLGRSLLHHRHDVSVDGGLTAGIPLQR